MTFTQFDLHPELLKALADLKLTVPTPVQTQAIPLILAGKDLRASAQTGTGKTAAFVLPALHRLADGSRGKKGPRILILTPTRELATQVANEVKKFSSHLVGLKTVCIFGGIPYAEQNRQLRRPYDILVATPGRLIDQVEQERVNLSEVEILILDEADRMLDMGFIDPVLHIAKQTPKTRQTLLFSATLKGAVMKLSEQLLNNPEEVSIAHTAQTQARITEHFQLVDNFSHKIDLLMEIVKAPEVDQAIVFTATKRSAEELADQLAEKDLDTAALHGDMRQRARDRTLKQMRHKKIQILVATDVAARGLDLDTISHVINFDLPMSAEDYVHRIGRTGRAGREGIAHSLVSKRDFSLLKQIERFTGKAIALLQTEAAKKRPNSSGDGPRKPFKKKGFFSKKKKFAKPFRRG